MKRISAAFFLLAGCGALKPAGSHEAVHSLDGVKLISPTITDQYDPVSFTQERYELGPERRLLLRFERLKENEPRVSLGGDKKVELELTLSRAEDLTAAQGALHVRSLTRTWMMRGTWDFAYPFFWPQGRWILPGGDYDPVDQPLERLSGDRKLIFDVTAWFLNYPRARQENFGLIVLSDQTITIEGDLSAGGSPRVTWKE